MSRLVIIALVVTLGVVLHCPEVAASYMAQSLGIASGYDASWATDINNAAIVTCAVANAYDIGGVYTWSTRTGAVPLQGINAFAGINNYGQTAGVYSNTNPNLKFEPLIRNSDGTENRLHVPESVSNAWVHKILDNSSIYATYEYRDAEGYVINNEFAVIDETSTTTYIELGNENISSIVVSDSGLFVLNNKYFWSIANGISIIPFLVNEENVDVQCISNNGWIVGFQNGALVRWDSEGNKSNLGLGVATGINTRGQVVGSINNRAVMWDVDGSLVNLPSLEGYMFAGAAAINDHGQIVGSAWINECTSMAVLWQPVPEPSSLIALLGGLTGIGGIAWRRRK